MLCLAERQTASNGGIAVSGINSSLSAPPPAVIAPPRQSSMFAGREVERVGGKKEVC